MFATISKRLVLSATGLLLTTGLIVQSQSSEWRAQRAQAYKVGEAELEEVYRQRSMLKLGVFPEDIAEGVYFFASDLSAKSTGNILNVDAGHAPSFTR